MMADRTVRVVLTATTQAFDRAMQAASNSAKSLRSEMEAAHKSGALDQMAGQVGGIGAAWTAVNAVVASTGISYNTLQQTSRAALKTLTGSAKEANAQMDKLDAFATTSPFAKDVFITAQQQMLGFGIEAEKVIPYLSAINDATAAMGGNNHTVAELSRIMSQISATAKITAGDLREFGNRGIDAATIIGEQMGVTGAQIRDQITEGTLDAQVALDALADGMTERFGGASAAVKETMTGALDRVKAAFRDLSAEIVSSAVDPDGGGWLVDLTNRAADALRAIQKLPQPVKEAVGAMSGIGGVALLAVGGLTKLVDVGLSMRDTWSQLANDMPRFTGALSKVGGVAAAAAVSFGLVVSAAKLVTDETRPMGDFADALERAANAAEAMRNIEYAMPERTFAGMEISASNMAEAFRSIYFYQGEFGKFDFEKSVSGFFGDAMGAFGLESTLNESLRVVEELDSALANLGGQMSADVFAQIIDDINRMRAEMDMAAMSNEELVARFPEYAETVRQQLTAASDEWTSYSTSTNVVAEAMRGNLAEGLVMTEQGIVNVSQAAERGMSATGGMAGSAERLAEVLALQADAAYDAAQGISEYYNTMLGLSSSTIAFEAAIDSATEAIAENGKTHDIATEEGRKNQAALDAVASSAIRVAEDMAKAGSSTEEIADHTSRARGEFVKAAEDMGYSAAAAGKLADDYGLIPELVSTLISQPGMELSQEETEALIGILHRVPREVQTMIQTIADLSGYYDVDQALNRIAGRTVTAYVAMKQYGQAALADGGRVGDALDKVRGMTTGGRVYGPGTTTSDEAGIVALSRDEYVLRAWAASRIGYDNLDRMNATGQLPPQNLVQRTATTSTITNNHHTSSAPQVTLNVTLPHLTGAAAAEGLVRELDAVMAQYGD